MVAPDDFPNSRFRDRGIVEYIDDVLHVVAAYPYSHRNHASQWLLIRVGLGATETMVIHQEDIVLVRPDGVEIPVGSTRQRTRDIEGVTQLLNEARHWYHPVYEFYPRIDRYIFHFSADPDGGIPDRFVTIGSWQYAQGDLLFASPDGVWENGVYALVVSGRHGLAAELPIVLE